MVDLATKEISRCLISRIEEDLPIPNYSYKTIDYVIETLGYPEVYFCLGSDSIDSFRSWKDYDKILERVRLLVAQRKANFTLPAYLESKAIMVEHELKTISSTDLRGKLQTGEQLEKYLHSTTIDYISKHNLYR
jgi:nicotinate-nucleotide adenylyltransferase